MRDLIRVLPGRRLTDPEADPHLQQEWLVTNGLGGYASGTVSGAITRRYHGLLIAALPNPLGRMMMLNGLSERLRLPDRTAVYTGAEELSAAPPESTLAATEFRLEAGLPVWRYEVAGFHAPSLVGLARSAGWLAMQVGLPWAHARAAGLAHAAAVRLADTPGVTLVTPPDRMATLVTFRIPGWPAERVVEELARRVLAIVRPIPALDAVRISVGFFTTAEELARVLDAVAELARHTPDSLPPHPAIEFIELPPA